MTALLTTYEVIVEEKNAKRKEYRSSMGVWCDEELHHRMHHIKARTGEQARIKAEKYGHPVIVRKKHRALDRLQAIERIKLDQKPQIGIYQIESPRNTLLAEDEFIWAKQQKKRENMSKDKARINRGLTDIIET